MQVESSTPSVILPDTTGSASEAPVKKGPPPILLPHGSEATEALFDSKCNSFWTRLGIRAVTIIATPFVGGAFVAGAIYATARTCYHLAATIFEAGASLFTWDRQRLADADKQFKKMCDEGTEAITQMVTAAMLVPYLAVITLVDPTATTQRLALVQDAWDSTTEQMAKVEEAFRLRSELLP